MVLYDGCIVWIAFVLPVRRWLFYKWVCCLLLVGRMHVCACVRILLNANIYFFVWILNAAGFSVRFFGLLILASLYVYVIWHCDSLAINIYFEVDFMFDLHRSSRFYHWKLPIRYQSNTKMAISCLPIACYWLTQQTVLYVNYEYCCCTLFGTLFCNARTKFMSCRIFFSASFEHIYWWCTSAELTYSDMRQMQRLPCSAPRKRKKRKNFCW